MKYTNKGFTLIELMIALAIMGLISAWAIPSYRTYMLRANASEALAALSTSKLRLEQFFQDNRTYEGACDAKSSSAPPKTNKFAITCELDTDSYTITATGLGFVYSVDQNNNKKTTSVPSKWKKNETCWVINPQGDCQ